MKTAATIFFKLLSNSTALSHDVYINFLREMDLKEVVGQCCYLSSEEEVKSRIRGQLNVFVKIPTSKKLC